MTLWPPAVEVAQRCVWNSLKILRQPLRATFYAALYTGTLYLERAANAHPVESSKEQADDTPDARAADDEAIEVWVREEAPRTASANTRTRDVLEASPHRTGSDLMRTVPGVFITQHSGEGKAHQIFFRGFDAAHGQDLEVSVGGVPVNDVSNVHGQGYADLHFVIPELVERIEVLPGAFHPTQGDFAIAGSLRYRLAYPHPGITTSFGAGSFDTQRLFFVYQPADHSSETFGAFEIYDSAGFGVGRAASRANALGQWVYDLDVHTSLRVLTSTYAGRFGSAGVVRPRDVDAGIVDRFDTYDPNQGGHSARHQLAIEWQHASAEWDVTWMPYVVGRSLMLQQNYTGALLNPTHGDNTQQTHDALTLGFTSRIQRRLHLLSDQDQLGAGLFTRHDSIEQTQRFSRGASTVDASIHATNVAGFLDAGVRLVPRVFAHFGFRVDGLSYAVEDRLLTDASEPTTPDARSAQGIRDLRSAQGVHLGPKATLDVAIAPGFHGFAGYGAGFRSPQARGLDHGDRSPFTRVDGFELGARYRDPDRIEASIAGHASFLSDDLVFNETVARNEPAPATQRLGLTADFTARSGEWFVSTCGAGYTHATFRASGGRFLAGDVVPFAPQWVTRCDLSGRRQVTDVGTAPLFAKLGGGFHSLFNRPMPFGEMGSNVFLIDAQAGIELKQWQLLLQSQNLLDTGWNDGEFVYASAFASVPNSAVPQRHVSAGAPRTWFATLTLRL